MICIYWSEGKCMYKPPAVPQKARSLPFWSPPKIFLQFALKKKTNIIFFVGAPLISGPQKFRVWTAPSTDWWGCQEFYKYWMFDVSNEVCDDMKGAKIILSLLLLFFLRRSVLYVATETSHENEARPIRMEEGKIGRWFDFWFIGSPCKWSVCNDRPTTLTPRSQWALGGRGGG